MKLRVRVYLNHHCTTIFHGDMAVTRHRVIAVFVFLTSEIPILEQKYQFHLTHCRNKVVRYEITSPCIFESSLYDHGDFMNATEIAVLGYTILAVTVRATLRMTRTLRNACIGQQISVSSVDALIGTWMRTIHCLL